MLMQRSSLPRRARQRFLLVVALGLGLAVDRIPAADPPAPPAAPAKPVAPAPPQTVAAPAPQNVKVTTAHPVESFRIDEYFVGPPAKSLVGATILIRPFKKWNESVAGGRIEIEVLADGPLVVAVSFQYDGRVEDAWKEQLWDAQKFQAEGWRLVDAADMVNPKTLQPHLYFFYRRVCKAGEKFAIRTRKYNPPWVVVPADATLADGIVAWEPNAKLPEEVQRDLVAQKFRALLIEKRFDDLEAWTTRYLKTSAMFPSGHYKIVSTRRLTGYDFRRNPLTVAQSKHFLDLSDAWLQAIPTSIAARLTTADAMISHSEALDDEDSDRHGGDIDEYRRRALELLYEVEQADPTIVDAYRSILVLAGWANWSEELVDVYVDRILANCGWSVSALDRAYNLYTRPRGDGRAATRNARLQKFFELVAEKTRDRYGDALLAAMLANWRHTMIDWPMRNYGLTWPRVKASFEDWLKLFPDSPRIKQQFCLYACISGDRPTAARMFATFTDAEADVEELWGDRERLASKRVWAADDFATGEQIKLLEYPIQPILSAAVRDDGRVFLVDAVGAIAVLDPAGGRKEQFPVSTYQAPYYTLGAHRFSIDGRRYLYGAYYGSCGMFDLRTKVFHRYVYRPTGDDAVTAAAFAPDQTSVIVAAGTKKFVVYEAPPTSLEAYQRNAPFREFPITRGSEVRGLEVLDEGRSFAALTRDGTVEVRKYDDGAEIKSWKAHPESDARAMTASAGGGLIATVADKQVIRVWGVPSGELIAELPKLPLVIESLAFSPNGRLLAAGEASRGSRPNAVHLFDLSTKQLVKTYVGHKGPISALQFLPDGELLMSASRDMSVRYWKLPTE